MLDGELYGQFRGRHGGNTNRRGIDRFIEEIDNDAITMIIRSMEGGEFGAFGARKTILMLIDETWKIT